MLVMSPVPPSQVEHATVVKITSFQPEITTYKGSQKQCGVQLAPGVGAFREKWKLHSSYEE